MGTVWMVILMRKIFALLLSTLLIGQQAYALENADEKPQASEQVILRLLSIPAQNAITGFYGEPRQYYQDALLGLRHVESESGSGYEIVMQVVTFVGPHNPPYGIETMTFFVSYGVPDLQKFEHQDKTW